MTFKTPLKAHLAMAPEAQELPVLYFKLPKWKLGQYGAGLEDKIKFSADEETQVADANADGTMEYVVFKCEPVSETYFTPTLSRKIVKPPQ